MIPRLLQTSSVNLSADSLHEKIFKFSLEALKLDFKLLKECFSIGFPMALTSFVVMVGVLLLSFVN